MNKVLLLLFLFLSFNCKAEDSLDVAPVKLYHFTEKDVLKDDGQIEPVHFDKNFKERYTSGDFNYTEKRLEKSLWTQFVEWLKHKIRNLFGASNAVSSTTIEWTFYVLSTIIILTVIYLIVKAILNREGQWVFGKSTTKKIIAYDDIERNLKDIDFEKLIRDTLKSNDKRLAIRYYYLWILKKLSEKSIIDWNPEKTNSDYSYEIKSENLRKDFNYVSYLYNYIWYGEFDLDDVAFEDAKNYIEKTLKSI